MRKFLVLVAVAAGVIGYRKYKESSAEKAGWLTTKATPNASNHPPVHRFMTGSMKLLMPARLRRAGFLSVAVWVQQSRPARKDRETGVRLNC